MEKFRGDDFARDLGKRKVPGKGFYEPEVYSRIQPIGTLFTAIRACPMKIRQFSPQFFQLDSISILVEIHNYYDPLALRCHVLRMT